MELISDTILNKHTVEIWNGNSGPVIKIHADGRIEFFATDASDESAIKMIEAIHRLTPYVIDNIKAPLQKEIDRLTEESNVLAEAYEQLRWTITESWT